VKFAVASARQNLAAFRTYLRHNITSLASEVKFFYNRQLSTVNCQPSTVIPVEPDLVLFHVSAVGVPSWVIGQKSKYEQGNKE
jgi:hypothetical protein